jgi:hypothetical protein
VEGLSQEWRCGEPIRRPERQQERCREKQRVKVICLAASFGYLIKCICATKAAEANSRMPGRRQPATKYVLSEDSRRSWKRNHTQWNIVEMQNPAHSLHTVGLRMQASGVGPQTLDVNLLNAGAPLLAQFARGWVNTQRQILSGKRPRNPTLQITKGGQPEGL